MHFAMPPSRKLSHPPPYASKFAPARSSPLMIRRSRLQAIALFACGVLAIVFLFSRIFSSSPGRPPAGTPEVVVVTMMENEGFSKEYLDHLKRNREEYAEKHGYAVFLPNRTDYDLKGAPPGWARIPAMRHAMTVYPHSEYFFFLEQHSLIINLELSLTAHITSKNRLESLMLRDRPVVPPDSVIKTFPHLRGDRVDFILTQDGDGLAQGSFILRRGEWARFFLDTWFDPLFRSYNFQKAEAHALEHIVQWHPTILTKLALVPQRTMNSYAPRVAGRVKHGHEIYKEGDFVIRFPGCDFDTNRDCEKELKPYFEQLEKKQTAGDSHR